MKDKITIEIELEKMNNELGRINNLIKRLVKDLGEIEGLEVLRYSQIQKEFIIPE